MKLSKKTIAVSTASLVIVGGASAFAYVSATGTGGGSAGTVNASTVTVTVNASVEGSLAPNGSQPITLTAINAKTYTVAVKTVTVAVDPTWVPPTGCAAGDFSVTPATLPSGGFAVSPGATVAISGAGYTAPVLHLADATTDECLGLSSVPLTVTVTR